MRLLLLPLALVLAVGCQDDAPLASADTAPAPEAGTVSAVASPAGPGSATPRLALAPDGAPLLSWTEPDTADGAPGHALRFSLWRDGAWGEPETAARGTDWFVNWADTPGVMPLASGRLLAHTLPMHPEGNSPYAYDAAFRLSSDGDWTPEALLHDDGLPAEHGFVSAVPLADGAGAVWLDGREQAGGGHGHHGAGAMTLRYARIDGASGALADEAVLDARVCDCCPTAMVAAGDAPGAPLVAAYRDRSEGETRDIAVVRLVDGAWTEPVVPHADGWEIAGCPVNGPALAARGERVALAWFTAEGDRPRVRFALSDDAGATWGPALTLDDAAPIGRVGVAMLGSGGAAVSWLASDGDEAVLVVQRVLASGETGPRVEVARLGASRASGIPRIVPHGPGARLAWTDPAAEVPPQTASAFL